MATFSEALKEAYASAPKGEIALDTVEILHPSFEFPIRLVRGNKNIFAKLEDDADQDGGKIVEFIAAPWDFIKPSIEEDKIPEFGFTFDNVSKEISQAISEAVVMPLPVKLIYRPYLLSALEYGPELNPPIEMELADAYADNYTIKITANMEDTFFAAFMTQRYVNERFPAVSYVS